MALLGGNSTSRLGVSAPMHELSQPHTLTWWIGFAFGVVGGSLIVGALLGLIPLVLGQYLGQTKLGRLGFLASVLAGFIAGIFGAVPVSLGFATTVYTRWRRSRTGPDTSFGTGP